jgi:hypothetical protein
VSSRRLQPRARARRFCGLAFAGALAALGAVAPGAHGAAAASVTPGCSTVHVGPLPVAGERVGDYFALGVSAGQRREGELVVANPTARPCRVGLLGAVGHTAQNSGDSYVPIPAGSHCAGSACWLAGVPRTVTVPAYGRVTVPFSVTVPAGTVPGEYLAGIIGQPVGVVDAANRPGVHVRVITRVAIGVAVTVPGQLRPHLMIPTVSLAAGTDVGASVLEVTETDGGNTWEHPVGTATIDVRGRSVTVPVKSDTVLPGGRATIAASTGSIPAGTHPARVVLWYDEHRKFAVWEGGLHFAAPPTVKRVGNRIIVTAPARVLTRPARAELPLWMIGLLVIVGILSLSLCILVLLLLFRRRRHDDPAGRAPGSHRPGIVLLPPPAGSDS